jgi:hypothetical protein
LTVKDGDHSFNFSKISISKTAADTRPCMTEIRDRTATQITIDRRGGSVTDRVEI